MTADWLPFSTTSRQLAMYAGNASVPGDRRSLENAFWYVFKPSSIQAYRRSFEPTIIGNHWCPCSWSSVENTDGEFSAAYPTMTNMGYSMPATGPATVVACG